jgi:hypothetical protein
MVGVCIGITLLELECGVFDCRNELLARGVNFDIQMIHELLEKV